MNLVVRRPPRGEIRATVLPGKHPYRLIFLSYLGLLLLSNFSNALDELKWYVSTNGLIVFGEELRLTCKEVGTVCTETRKWLGGKDYSLLCFDDTSTNPSKYQMMSYKQNNTFDLMIKQLKYEDIGWDYTCTCGFVQYTQKLQLQNLKFTYPPNMNTNSSCHQEGDIFTLIFSIEKVFPVPNCSIIYSSKGVMQTDHVTNLTTELLPDGVMYKVIITLAIDISQYKCLENINLSCNVLSRTYDLYSRNIGSCSGEIIQNTSLLILLLIIPIIIIINGCCVVVIRKYRDNRRFMICRQLMLPEMQ